MMPLPEALATTLRDTVTDRLPPTVMRRVTPMGEEGEIEAYVDRRSGPLDALGLPEYQGRLLLDPHQPLVSPGDELDDEWVAWATEVRAGAWRAVDLRRKPPLIEWERQASGPVGRDPVTRAPIIGTVTSTIEAHLHRVTLTGAEGEGTERDLTRATLIVRGAADCLRLGDSISSVHGRYRVTATEAYGPWARATLEAY
jgi:hypothetical protein